MIDAHIHIENRNREDLELMSLAGIKAVVGMVWYPASYAFDSAALFEYYNRAIKWEPVRTKGEMIDTFVGVGVSMVAIPTDWEKAIAELPKYFKEEKVVCIGECGLEPSSKTPLEVQEEVFKAQLALAKEYDMPVSIHVPFKDQGKWIEKYNAMIEDAKLDKSKVALDHMQLNTINLAWETGCYAGMTVQPWRNVTPLDAAKVVMAGENLDRLLIDSDCSASKASDSLSVPKAIREMRKLGVDEKTIDMVSTQNAIKFYNLPL